MSAENIPADEIANAWRVGERNSSGIEIRAANNFLVARVSIPPYSIRGKEWREENQNCIDNAKSIARVPSLLAALREIAEYSGDDTELDYNAAMMRKTARDAIAGLKI